MKLTMWQQAQIAIRGYAYSHHEKREGWKGSLPFYITRCRDHGLYTDFPHGYKKQLRCPVCARAKGVN